MMHGACARLVRHDPQNTTRRLHLATSHNRLGELDRLRGDTVDAAEHFHRAAEICDDLLNEEPEHPTYRWTQSFCYERLSAMAEAGGDAAAAREWGEKMYALKEQLAATADNPTHQLEFAVACTRMARLLKDTAPDVARVHLKRGVALLLPLREAEPENKLIRETLETCQAELAETAEAPREP